MAKRIRSKVLPRFGQRERKGIPNPKLTPEERVEVGKILVKRRQRRVTLGKQSYQPSRQHFA